MSIERELVESILKWQALHDGELPSEIMMSCGAFIDLSRLDDFSRFSPTREKITKFYGVQIKVTGDNFYNFRLV